MQEEKRRERTFVKHEVRRLIERAAENFAQRRGLRDASVSKDDIAEMNSELSQLLSPRTVLSIKAVQLTSLL